MVGKDPIGLNAPPLVEISVEVKVTLPNCVRGGTPKTSLAPKVATAPYSLDSAKDLAVVTKLSLGAYRCSTV
jgi:hypothetical protein